MPSGGWSGASATRRLGCTRRLSCSGSQHVSIFARPLFWSLRVGSDAGVSNRRRVAPSSIFRPSTQATAGMNGARLRRITSWQTPQNGCPSTRMRQLNSGR